MKKLIAGLLIVGTSSVMAQEFKWPQIDSAYIRASSHLETVCSLLTEGKSLNVKSYTVIRPDFKTYDEIVKIKKGGKILEPKVYFGSSYDFAYRPKVIEKLVCD